MALKKTKSTGRKHVQPESGPEKAFGQALRAIREEKGISQERLALDAGFDRTFVSLLERGLRSPTIRTVVKPRQGSGRRLQAKAARTESWQSTGTGRPAAPGFAS